MKKQIITLLVLMGASTNVVLADETSLNKKLIKQVGTHTLPAPAQAMSDNANGVPSLPNLPAVIASQATSNVVPQISMVEKSQQEAANEKACNSKRCILTVNGAPLAQTVFIAGNKATNTYKVAGWGLGGKILFAKLNVNNRDKLDFKVVSNTNTEVVLEMPNDVKVANGQAQLVIAVSGDGFGVYGKELAKFENQTSKVNDTFAIDSNVTIKSPGLHALSDCKNCISTINDRLTNVTLAVGGGNYTIKGEGFGAKQGSVILQVNTLNSRDVPLEIVGGVWSDTLIIAKLPDSLSGLMDDSTGRSTLSVKRADGKLVTASGMLKPVKFKAARETITLNMLDIPRKIQQEGVAPTNMRGEFYHQELHCDKGDNNCKMLEHGFTDQFMVDTVEGFEILKEQTQVIFDYTTDILRFSSDSSGKQGDFTVYWYPQNKPFGQLGNYEWRGNALYVNRYMKQYYNNKSLTGSGGDSYYVSGAKVLVKVSGPRGISPLHISGGASKK